ncbi:hypothetical protein GCM10023335_39020 [Streptomyces siamensis]|uniref:Uncharacterized protein n=1 Tax=Streptomyces siamensis TaxID=1274986 RepID=A0ABP9IYL9_9ACTN
MRETWTRSALVKDMPPAGALRLPDVPGDCGPRPLAEQWPLANITTLLALYSPGPGGSVTEKDSVQGRLQKSRSSSLRWTLVTILMIALVLLIVLYGTLSLLLPFLILFSGVIDH